MKLIIYLRSVIATILFPFTIAIMGPAAIIAHIIFQNKKIDDAVVSAWGRMCCWLSGVEVVVHGKENNPDEPCLFLFNHTSFFDIFALAGWIPEIRFGAKAELFKLPIFGHAMKAVGTLPIARANRQEVFKIYEEAKQRFSHGEKFALSPEGGRFYGKDLASFKAGPFVFAMSAQVPVVPVIITGAYEILPKGQILFNKKSWKSKINLYILPPIQTSTYTQETRTQLQKLVYEQMNQIWSASTRPS